MQGYYRISKQSTDPNGIPCTQPLTGWVPNRITTNGLTLFISDKDYLKYIHLGNGTTPTSMDDTALESLLLTSEVEAMESYSSSDISARAWFSIEEEIQVSEVGIGKEEAGNLFSRALIRPYGDRQEAVTLEAGLHIQVEYRLTLDIDSSSLNSHWGSSFTPSSDFLLRSIQEGLLVDQGAFSFVYYFGLQRIGSQLYWFYNDVMGDFAIPAPTLSSDDSGLYLGFTIELRDFVHRVTRRHHSGEYYNPPYPVPSDANERIASFSIFKAASFKIDYHNLTDSFGQSYNTDLLNLNRPLPNTKYDITLKVYFNNELDPPDDPVLPVVDHIEFSDKTTFTEVPSMDFTREGVAKELGDTIAFTEEPTLTFTREGVARSFSDDVTFTEEPTLEFLQP